MIITHAVDGILSYCSYLSFGYLQSRKSLRYILEISDFYNRLLTKSVKAQLHTHVAGQYPWTKIDILCFDKKKHTVLSHLENKRSFVYVVY